MAIETIIVAEILKIGVRPIVQRVFVATGLHPDESSVAILEINDRLRNIEHALNQIENKIDENRLAVLLGGYRLLRDASHMRRGRGSVLERALSGFMEITSLPSKGKTGEWKNNEIKALALIGAATAHHELGSSEHLVADYFARGCVEDHNLAASILTPDMLKSLTGVVLTGKANVIFKVPHGVYLRDPLQIQIYDNDRKLFPNSNPMHPLLFLINFDDATVTVAIEPGRHILRVVGDPGYIHTDSVPGAITLNAEAGKQYHLTISWEHDAHTRNPIKEMLWSFPWVVDQALGTSMARDRTYFAVTLEKIQDFPFGRPPPETSGRSP